MWDMNNTEGFTHEQLDGINAVIERLMADREDIDSHAVDAAISNEWREGLSEGELYEAVVRRLGVTRS